MFDFSYRTDVGARFEVLATLGPCLHLLYFSIGTCYNNLQNFGNVWVIFTRKTFFGFLVSANAQMIHVVMIGSYCNLNLAQRNFLWLFHVEMITSTPVLP